jgi:hypothetical protein
MSLKLRLAFARSQNIISTFHRLAVRSSPCYVHSSLFSTRISKSPSSDDDEDNDEYADDIDTSPLDNLLRMKPAILRR